MIGTQSLRPGARLGPFPERAYSEVSTIERRLLRFATHFRPSPAASRRRWRTLLDLTDNYGQQVAYLHGGAWKSWLCGLRRRLRTKGFTIDTVAQSFATVREAAKRRLGMRHFDVQLIGAWIMVEGMLAEMQTGEGKTLTATLTASTAALAGVPVHIVTVNDYLVSRDATDMAPLYRALGLSVGTVTHGMDDQARRAAYRCDVVYVTSKQLVFDYLRDHLAFGGIRDRLRFTGSARAPSPGHGPLLRGLCFGIVDEADSVLIDEARVPLIISRPGRHDENHSTYEQALKIAQELDSHTDFIVDAQERTVDLTIHGRNHVQQVAKRPGGIETGATRREMLVNQALCALHLFRRDIDYVIRDGRVAILDENTGRAMPDRAWGQGLHALIEIKEGITPSSPRESLAQITYQRFFRRYLRLSGMTGTASEVRRELHHIYSLRVVEVPPRRPLRLRCLPDRLYVRAADKWQAVVDAVRDMSTEGRPVLVGTRTVADSERLSRLLTQAEISHRVLNAHQDREEADIIAGAGHRGCVTVATNMAGRGTDIRLAPGVQELGGLHVVVCERNLARRVDRQLAGRGGRQGDPGSCEAILSLEDELARQYVPEIVLQLAQTLWPKDRYLPAAAVLLFIALPQRFSEWHHRELRRALLHQDERLCKALAFAGRTE